MRTSCVLFGFLFFTFYYTCLNAQILYLFKCINTLLLLLLLTLRYTTINDTYVMTAAHEVNAARELIDIAEKRYTTINFDIYEYR